MKQLSHITDYRHSNVYVQREKIVSSISQMKELLTQQYKTKIVEIPSYILRDEIKKANSLLSATNRIIEAAENLTFRFGG